jgi:hypothetical protein
MPNFMGTSRGDFRNMSGPERSQWYQGNNDMWQQATAPTFAQSAGNIFGNAGMAAQAAQMTPEAQRARAMSKFNDDAYKGFVGAGLHQARKGILGDPMMGTMMSYMSPSAGQSLAHQQVMGGQDIQRQLGLGGLENQRMGIGNIGDFLGAIPGMMPDWSQFGGIFGGGGFGGGKIGMPGPGFGPGARQGRPLLQGLA